MGKHPVNVCVERRDGESDEKFIKRFMRKVRKEEIVREVMDRRYHKKPSEKRKQKEERATHRRRIEERRRRRSRGRGRDQDYSFRDQVREAKEEVKSQEPERTEDAKKVEAQAEGHN